MSRSLVRSCAACRHSILDSFAALAGVSIGPQSTRLQWTPSRPLFKQSVPLARRMLSSTPSARKSDSPVADQTPDDDDKASPSSTTSIPWYLQVQTPEPPARNARLHALEEIPPVPADAPPVLHPILSHLSIQTGLDNLALIDLRTVHPPPALGSNLLMVIGTARSYKHLNTSADRFCRWLRSTYKLSPYADGLLGRNELKLKLRRKARRMRLAQSVGNTVAMGATEGGDDGITTGWVCVNVGPVDGVEIEETSGENQTEGSIVSMKEQEEIGNDEDEYHNPPDDSGVIGFGTTDSRPRIVVQMFLEEKRIEMDLEGLWDSRVQRRERKEMKLDRAFEDDDDSQIEERQGAH